MNKKSIYILIALMTVALLGLAGLQFYWVNIALQVSRERFKQSVQDALMAVSLKLEQHEAVS